MYLKKTKKQCKHLMINLCCFLFVGKKERLLVVLRLCKYLTQYINF